MNCRPATPSTASPSFAGPSPRAPLLLFGCAARLVCGCAALALVLGAGLPTAEAGPVGAASAASPSTSPRGPALVAALKTKRLKRVEFKELSLKDLTNWLRIATGWNVLPNHAALAKAGIDATALSFTADFEYLSVATLLDVLLEPLEMAVRVHENLIFLTTKADAQGRLITRVYGISHITWQKIDFIAPQVHLNPSGAIADEYEPEVVDESDPLANGEAVAELLKDIVAPGEWDSEGWSMRATNTYVVIRAPVAVHAKIPGALDTISSLK